MGAFRVHLGLLLELIDATSAFGNDSKEADAIRDRMEASWLAMDEQSSEAILAISAEFNRLEDYQPSQRIGRHPMETKDDAELWRDRCESFANRTIGWALVALIELILIVMLLLALGIPR